MHMFSMYMYIYVRTCTCMYVHIYFSCHATKLVPAHTSMLEYLWYLDTYIGIPPSQTESNLPHTQWYSEGDSSAHHTHYTSVPVWKVTDIPQCTQPASPAPAKQVPRSDLCPPGCFCFQCSALESVWDCLHWTDVLQVSMCLSLWTWFGVLSLY